MIEYDRIKRLAKKQNITLTEVNTQAGLGTNSIYNWKIKRPSSDALKSVAQILHTSTDYLCGLTNNPLSQDVNNDSSFISLDGNIPYVYEGYYVPQKYIDIIHMLMKSDIKEGCVKKINVNRVK